MVVDYNQSDKVEITPEMIQAGILLLADEWGVVSRNAAEPMVVDLFRAMLAARSKNKEMR